ncbi:DUF6046 domain-containing protein [Pedobacter sp. SL55]|uniref:DUF6046 domain-containing protein n=1 Tax=Pedobacter sp. SL55 TaxID=2995161 RepID=UPI0022720F8B|nr:DUF6046 domain-containing protein [Pedobacter sp. SL55]WAC40586.1 DUF6046 domain-containing protein [Pedobacter sp. SL55]
MIKQIIEDRGLKAVERVTNVAGTPVVYDIANIMNTLYGYRPISIGAIPEASDTNEFVVPAGQIKKTTTIKGTPIYGQQDMLGREVFCPLTLSAGGIDYEFPFCVIGVRSRKIIVETPMVERNGAVIEEIACSGYDFSVKGFLIDPNNQFPDEQLNKLKELYETNEPIVMKSALTDLFLEKDDRVVMRNLEIPEKAKVIGVRDYTFELVQDGVFDLYAVD